ncbi:MAG TPA: hypothetical protein VFI42_00505 [Thermomicrobiaceae bacterium]|nr:hypothetical protein [Thermomicrobiaceae bacterium]
MEPFNIDVRPAPIRERPRLGQLYHAHFADPRRERLFLSSLSFFLTIIIVRGITHAIRAGFGPFHNITAGALHIHHLVPGIVLLLAVGYLQLLQPRVQGRLWLDVERLLAILYGLGAGLTLDEFALWLHLQDVYWLPQGHESWNAIELFFSILSIGWWGGPFFRALGHDTLRFLRRLD